MLSIVYLAVTFGIALSIGFSAFQLKLLAFVAVNQIFISFIFYFRTNVAAFHRFKLDSLLSVLDRTLLIGICGILLWHPFFSERFTIEWFVYAQTGALAMAALTSFVIVARQSAGFRFSVSRKLVVNLLKSTYPYAIIGILMSVYNRIDGVMLDRLLPETGAREAGIYAAGFRILDAATMLGLLFANFLLPMFSRMIRHREPVGGLLGQSFKALLAVAIAVAAASFFYRQEIIHLLYPAATGYWEAVFGLLMFSFIPISAVYIFGALLTANGSLKQLNIIASVGVALNIGRNYFLIKNYQAMGATVATVVTQLLIAGAQIIVAQRVMRLRTNHWLIGMLVVYTVVVFALHYFSVRLSASWAVNLSVALGGSAVLALGLGLVEVKALFQKIRSARSD